ncbi:PRD domain-containing protein [Pantoea endophytica]|uniref:PRD domain-containing protein n=1 Tax=Pantoea endophytica TaxID=92488 RepID=UPI00301AF26F
MKIIIKVLSNNAVLFKNTYGEECVALGVGVGFKKKFGDELDEENVDTQFIKRGHGMTETYLHILTSIPPACLTLAEKIIQLAKVNLRIDDNEESLFLALSDHIYYAVKRVKSGDVIRNLMISEIKCFYSKEFSVALQAVELMNSSLNMSFPEDEAGFLALHLANASNSSEMKETMRSAKIIKDILNILKVNNCNIEDQDSLNYNRTVTHLKYLSKRVFNRSQVYEQDVSIYEEIIEKMPQANSISKIIREYFLTNYDVLLTHDEQIFLTLHINRLI